LRSGAARRQRHVAHRLGADRLARCRAARVCEPFDWPGRRLCGWLHSFVRPGDDIAPLRVERAAQAHHHRRAVPAPT